MRRWISLLFPIVAVTCAMSTAMGQETPVDTVPATADTTSKVTVVEKLTYQQQPGLAMAASKIFFSKKRWSISGFGELNYVQYLGEKNRSSGDMELYYTNLYRFATFFGFRITDKIIWNSEFQIEFLHDGFDDYHYEIIFEAFMDFMPYSFLKARVGFFPLLIGYVNNNDEPVMFYSVNRSEVERIIVPSTWVELGVMAYGNITQHLSYGVALTPGLHASEFIGGTWIRQGRAIDFSLPRTWGLNAQLSYTGIKNTTLSVSTYHGTSGQGRSVMMDGVQQQVTAPIGLYTGYVRWAWKNITLTGVGAFGTMGQTDRVFQLTEDASEGTPQVLGSHTYGALGEVGVDILPYFRKNREIRHRKNWFYDTHDMKLPLFARYERLDTHAGLDPRVPLSRLNDPQNYGRNDLDVITVGLNFKPRENIVFKFNYQFRNNRVKQAVGTDTDFLEAGFGVIF